MNHKEKTLRRNDPVKIFRKELSANFGDPDNDGIFLQNLKQNDEVAFTTISGRNDGFAFKVKIRVDNPSQATARIISITKSTESYSEKVPTDPNALVVVRGHRKGKPVEGWVSIATNIYLSGKHTFYFVREVLINGQKIWPQLTATRH